MVPIIDTHIHIWDLQKSAYKWLNGVPALLNRTYLIDELEAQRNEAGVVAGVLVQADNTIADTELMLNAAHDNSWIKGVVAWLPLLQPEETERWLNEKFLAEKYFVGIRHLIHDEPDANWLLQPQVIESLKILAANQIPYDLVGVLPAHIKAALKVAELVPELKMVFDHINQPPIQTGERFGEWGSLMKAAALHENFHLKISGLGVTAGKEKFTLENIKPYIEFALNQFGEQRCFTGGDWPVTLLADSYANTWKIYKEALSSLLTETDLQKVFYDNAIKFYNLAM